jgi:hypothetical protein
MAQLSQSVDHERSEQARDRSYPAVFIAEAMQAPSLTA